MSVHHEHKIIICRGLNPNCDARLHSSPVPTTMSKRGAFIVIEGLDRSGKSTQAAALLRKLQDSQVSAKLIKFPGQHLLHRTI
jgi:adenylylsulfate kinase-like enzyme